MQDFKDQTVVVTGGSSGIGKAIVKFFSEREANVVFTYVRSEENAKQLVEKLSIYDGRISAQQCDITSAESITAFQENVIGQFGTVHILINNAGDVIKRGPFLEIENAVWNEAFQLNVIGAVNMIKAFLPLMIQQKYGRVINVSSGAAKIGGMNAVHYGASKAALTNLSKALSKEVVKSGVTVNVVSPGIIDTPIHKRSGSEASQIENLLPMGRMGEPEEVACLVGFLASKKAAYITGEDYGISGGAI